MGGKKGDGRLCADSVHGAVAIERIVYIGEERGWRLSEAEDVTCAVGTSVFDDFEESTTPPKAMRILKVFHLLYSLTCFWLQSKLRHNRSPQNFLAL